MANQRLIHNKSFEMARALLSTVQGCLRTEEHREAFECFYQTCKAGLEAYEIERERIQHRLRPMNN
jgi:hypothetical protein